LVARVGAQADRGLAAALAALLAAACGAHAQEGEVRAPFITTPPEVVAHMLQLADTGPQDFVIDLGSGDGRIVIAAARDHRARGLGIELDAKLVERARDNAQRAGVADRARFEEGDALKTDVSRASVVTIYLLPFLLDQLQPKLLVQMRPGARIVTHAFAFKGWKPDRAETVTVAARHAGQGGESRVFVWIVPAQLRGAWEAPGGWRLRVRQNFQEIEVEAAQDGKTLAVSTARLQGTELSFVGPDFSFRGRAEGSRLAGELQRGLTRAALVFERAR
jgi:protein-L-isoaspartate O-methyltransferase